MVMNRKGIAIGNILVAIFLICVSGCSEADAPPSKYPDFSTPEATLRTDFYAFQHRDYNVCLDAMSDDYRQKYGRTREEQFEKFKSYGDKVKIIRNKKRTVLNVEYKDFGDYDVKITWSDNVGSKIYIEKSYMPLKKIGNEWKIVFPKSEEQSDPSMDKVRAWWAARRHDGRGVTH